PTYDFFILILLFFSSFFFFFFFFIHTAPPEIYTLSLHDALPIFRGCRLLQAPPRSRLGHLLRAGRRVPPPWRRLGRRARACTTEDRKSTRLNSSHDQISYAVFCLKKKKKNNRNNKKQKIKR